MKFQQFFETPKPTNESLQRLFAFYAFQHNDRFGKEGQDRLRVNKDVKRIGFVKSEFVKG